MASILVNSLKRLYSGNKLTKEQVAERVEKGSITAEDYQEITGEAYVEPEAPAAPEDPEGQEDV